MIGWLVCGDIENFDIEMLQKKSCLQWQREWRVWWQRLVWDDAMWRNVLGQSCPLRWCRAAAASAPPDNIAPLLAADNLVLQDDILLLALNQMLYSICYMPFAIYAIYAFQHPAMQCLFHCSLLHCSTVHTSVPDTVIQRSSDTVIHLIQWCSDV